MKKIVFGILGLIFLIIATIAANNEYAPEIYYICAIGCFICCVVSAIVKRDVWFYLLVSLLGYAIILTYFMTRDSQLTVIVLIFAITIIAPLKYKGSN